MQKTRDIRAELKGCDRALSCGFVVRSSSPVLALCRKLVDAGYHLTTPLEAYRGDTLCLKVRSIGEAAGLRVNTKGTGFIKDAAAVPTATPMRQNRVA